MRLVCYATIGEPPKLIPASHERDWMDRTPDRHAYRCLPLSIANAHGWMILNPMSFTAVWNGGAAPSDVRVEADVASAPILADGHFGSGVLTFFVNALFRTDPGYDLTVSGPANAPKDAIQPLTGVVETDWSPFSFTMNWKFTRPNTPVRFERDEPFCMIQPVKRGMIEAVEPEIRPIEDDPDLAAAFAAWSNSRFRFNDDLDIPGSEASARRWQKDYFLGSSRFVEPPASHRTKLRPKPFRPLRRWREDSPMNHLDHEQNEDNVTGRARFRDGALVSSDTTIRIDADMAFEPDVLDFLWLPGFLDRDECASLAKIVSAPNPANADNATAMRQLGLDAIARENPDAARSIQTIARRVTGELSRFYELTIPLYTDSVHLVRMTEGTTLYPRAVRARADGAPHPRWYRDFASILFLNDDYEGGEFWFSRLDVAVRPKAGTLLAFTAGWHHEHAMTAIARGAQSTLPMFHTFNRILADPELRDPGPG